MNRFIMCMLLVAAGPVVGRSIPESGYSDDNGVVRVSVFMDLASEKNIKFPEGTAMLRANQLLHKACPNLPTKYSVAGRVVTNSHNRVEKTYSYVVEYDRMAIDAVVKQASIEAEKVKEDERIAAENAVGEKACAEKSTYEILEKGKIDATNRAEPGQTNCIVVCQNSATNNVALPQCVCKGNVTSPGTNITANANGQGDAGSITNETSWKVQAVEKVVASPTVQLKDLTVKDIADKLPEPKITEKNGFKQIDDDSFGGIDPMEE